MEAAKPKIIDFEPDVFLKLSIMSVKEGEYLKPFCEKILKDVASTGTYNSSIIKSLKVLIIDTERCNCIPPEVCELCNLESAYNVFKRKIINLVSETEQGHE